MSVHALRFYEREGLFPKPIRRDSGGRRVFDEDDLEWLDLCRGLRATGMPLPSIRRYAQLIGHGPGNEGERLALLREHEQRVTAHVRALDQALAAIRWKVGVYEARVTRGTADELWNPLAKSAGRDAS
jgi:DNA-binding transcriptional MerR regulator